jgi:hypothetical protein
MRKKAYKGFYICTPKTVEMHRRFLLILPLLLTSLFITAQTSYFDKIELLADTSVYSSKSNYIIVNGIKKVYFNYSENDCELEIRVYPRHRDSKIGLIPSRDFEIVDSLLKITNYLRVKLRFRNLTQTEMLRLSFEVEYDSIVEYEDVYLQPLANTSASVYPGDDQLFIGEEKVYEVLSNNPQNLNISYEWINTDNFDYRLSRTNDKVYLHLVPKKLGEQAISVRLSSVKPFLGKHEKLDYQLSPIEYLFNVKASRLQFLNLDKQELTYSEDDKINGIEVQLENSRLLQMEKT